MYYLINYTESITESRGFRNEKFSQILDNSILISGSWSHTHKKRIKSLSDKEYLLDNLAYNKNIGFKRIFSAWHFAYLLRKKIIKDDIIIDGCIISSINLEALILLPKNKIKKIIIDVRDIWPEAHTFSAKSIPFYLYSNFLNLFIKKFASNYFYVSPSFENWVKKNCKYEDAHYLPLCYDPIRWGEPNNTQNIEVPNKVKLGYIGNLNNQFSLDEILPLIQNTDVILEIIGEGESFKLLKSKIIEMGIKNKVVFWGYLSREKATDIVKSWDYGIVPQTINSKADLPNKFFDYLGAGIPIISYNDTWLGNYVSLEKLGFSIKRNIIDIDLKRDYIQLKKNIISHRLKYNSDVRYQDTLRDLF